MPPMLICLPRNLITFEKYEDGARSTLRVSNPSSHHIAMKMKTNSADRYNVKPHFCVLPPNSTRVIAISVLKSHMQSVVEEARASSIEGEKKKITFILFEWTVPPDVLSQVSESGADGEASSTLKSIWASYEKDPITSGSFLKHRFPIAVVDATQVSSNDGGVDARTSISSAVKGGQAMDDTINESFFSPGTTVPISEKKTLPSSDMYDTSTDTGYDTAAAAPSGIPSQSWSKSAPLVGTLRPRLPPQGPQGETVNYDSREDGPPVYGIPAPSSTNQGLVMTVEEAMAKRADYNRIVNQTLLLQSEMQGLEHALVSRDKEADDLRNTINELRQQLILANSAANQSESNTDGLRQRRKDPSASTTSTTFSNEPPEPDDNTVKGGIDEGGGCPLYVVLVVGLIMFLIGFIIPRATTINT
jgi:hypothetical protein